MCGRYRLKRHWEQDLVGTWRFIVAKIDLDEERADVRPTDEMPIIRLEDHRPIMEMRRWGILRLMPGAPSHRTGEPGKLVKKPLHNAKSETAAILPTFRKAFAGGRCLVPISSWYEWPALASGKQRVEISQLDQKTMFAAGLYETGKDFKSGRPVLTFLMLTTKPNEFLGNIRDRSPLILDPRDYENWLFGDVAQAQALCGVLPDSSRYDVRPAPEPVAAVTQPPESQQRLF